MTDSTPFIPNQPLAVGQFVTSEGRTFEVLKAIKRPTAPPKDGASYRLLPLAIRSALGIVDAASQGMDGDGDQAPLLQRLVDDLPVDTGSVVTLPAGHFTLSQTIDLGGRSVEMVGVYNSTVLHFPAGTVGVDLRRVNGGDYPRLRNVRLIADGSDPEDGLVDGVRSAWGGDYHYHGVLVSSIAQLENVEIIGFSGNSVHISANLGLVNDEFPTGQNASESQLLRVRVQRSGGNGFFIEGGDANSISFYGCGARDSGLHAFHDASFLGNQFYGCTAHRSDVHGLGCGHYAATDMNNSAGFFGCYGEGDSPKNLFSGRATAIGGLLYNDSVTSQFALATQGNRFSGIDLLQLTLAHNQVRFTGGNGSKALFLVPDVESGRSHWGLTQPERGYLQSRAIYEFFDGGVALPGRNRTQQVAGFATEWQYVGDVLYFSLDHHGTGFSQDLPMLLRYEPGDVCRMRKAPATHPQAYVCIEAGEGPAAKWRAEGHGAGPLNERPQASAALLGWRYFNTSDQLNTTCTGTAWV